MKLSIHPDIVGKPNKTERGYFCGNKQVNLGYGWMNVDAEWQDIFQLITTDGYASSAELSSNHRTDDDYVSRQICMVDVDDGMTINQLFTDDFYNEYGAGFYTTARHTDEHHRFRIMFVLEEPEYDSQKMRKIIRGLLEIYQAADRNCKDASRIYYGIPNCPFKECRDKVLPKYITDELIIMIDNMDNSAITQYKYEKTYDNIEYDDIFVGELLKLISNKVGTLQGDYDTFKTIAWATCHTVGQHTAQNLMMTYWPTKTKKEPHVIKTWKRDRSPTVGTLIKLSEIKTDERKLLEIQCKKRKLK
jgi:hypothetical protein